MKGVKHYGEVFLNRSQQKNTFMATQNTPVDELCSCKTICCNETRHTQLWLFTKTAEENWADMWVPPLMRFIAEAYHSFSRKASSISYTGACQIVASRVRRWRHGVGTRGGRGGG